MSEKEKTLIVEKTEKSKDDLFGDYIQKFGLEELESFLPFIKFVNFGDYVIGKFIKIEVVPPTKKLDETTQLHLEVIDSNITTINANTDNEQILENLKGLKIKFIIPTNALQKLQSENLIVNKSIVGVKKEKEGTYENKGNKLIIYQVFVRDE